jgi:zinc protease
MARLGISMKRSAFGVLGLAAAMGCAGTPRRVAALHYEAASPNANEFEAIALVPRPTVPSLAPLECPAIEQATLANGMRIVVAARHDFPSISARVVFRREPREAGDDWRLALIGAAYFAGGYDAAGGCSRFGCSMGIDAGAGNVEAVVGRLANAVLVDPDPQRIVLARLQTALQRIVDSQYDPWSSLRRNADAAAFGRTSYGQPAAWPMSGRLSDVQRVRAELLAPSSTTLVVVGDTSFAEVRGAVEQKWGARTSVAAPRASSSPLALPAHLASRVVVVDDVGTSQCVGAIVLRGPGSGDPDAVAFSLASQLLGGGESSSVFRVLRDRFGAAYAVDGFVTSGPAASLLCSAASSNKHTPRRHFTRSSLPSAS